MADLPEQFNTLWKEGDILVSDSKNLILFGGTERVLRSYYQYPIEHTLGSVLGYVPKGKNLKSNMVIGSPYIRIKNKSRYLNYSSFIGVLSSGKLWTSTWTVATCARDSPGSDIRGGVTNSYFGDYSTRER